MGCKGHVMCVGVVVADVWGQGGDGAAKRRRSTVGRAAWQLPANEPVLAPLPPSRSRLQGLQGQLARALAGGELTLGEVLPLQAALDEIDAER
jgi:hypothetical protein